jgi:hypothetical protein
MAPSPHFGEAERPLPIGVPGMPEAVRPCLQEAENYDRR